MGRPHSKGKVYIANESFATQIDGVDYVFRQWVTRVREGHPILERAGRYFDEIDAHLEVEDASAVPGTARGDTA